MNIFFNAENKIFHLQNEFLSYIMMVMPNGQIGQLYCGKKIRHKDDFSYLLELADRGHTAYLEENGIRFSLEHLKQEYPVYGTTDFRVPAVEVQMEDGSSVLNLSYVSHEIIKGKPGLEGLPATYVDSEESAMTLSILLYDQRVSLYVTIMYTIFKDLSVVSRSCQFKNNGSSIIKVNRAMSMSLDFPDSNYEWIQFSGAWGRERHVKKIMLQEGIHSIGSLRGQSSHQQNPFVIMKRPGTDEIQGEAFGFSLLYSGNFLAQAEVDTYGTLRFTMGIHPIGFQWKLSSYETFQTPEVVMVYSADGLNKMSQTLHSLYQQCLMRGYWKKRARPILCNNWEATYFDFNEEKILSIAKKAKECGVELFVLDDGWFGNRKDDYAGLGDWKPRTEVLPNGIKGLAEKIENLGLKFGLWFEPEMVNPDSDLYREHPDWIIKTPGVEPSQARHQYVLDFSRPEVVDNIYHQMRKILSEAKISYVKWDMNRSITECYSTAYPPDQQGEVFHRYILGMYSLYERLINEFPYILFESCSGGGGRFDAGMLYYAPQGWISDDSDSTERLKIQYGTSYGYPLSSMGSHVSAVPNHQVGRMSSMKTRANVAYFGTYGYELDLNHVSSEEQQEVKMYTDFMKQYRQLIQFGDFYRLQSPFEFERDTAWMVVSKDKREAIIGWYRVLNKVNTGFDRLKLQGLAEDLAYHIDGKEEVFYGDELMNIGLLLHTFSSGKLVDGKRGIQNSDYDSEIFVLKV